MLLRVGCISDRTLILIIMGVLICSFHLQTIGAEPLPQMQLETDKSVYELGENVTIILTNVANQTMIIGGYPAWQIYTHPLVSLTTYVPVSTGSPVNSLS
jgi:hypothetical protein